jgi:hypothetical protein
VLNGSKISNRSNTSILSQTLKNQSTMGADKTNKNLVSEDKLETIQMPYYKDKVIKSPYKQKMAG